MNNAAGFEWLYIVDVLHTLAEVGFWTAVVFVGYVYVGYPLTLCVLPRRRIGDANVGTLPRVTVLIAAHNEATEIVATVRNKLEQNYPPELLDVIVVSDGSTDGTAEMVEALGLPRVTVLRQEPRQGKTMALNRGVETASGELLVFSDANSLYGPDAVRRLTRPFEDGAVGYVTGQLVYRVRTKTAVGRGSGMYIRYENWIRRLETQVGSIVGVNGGIDAVRRSLYRPMRADQLPDLILPLRVVEQGYRVVYRDDAVSYEEALGQHGDEYKMRVRVSLRALHGIWEMRYLLAPRYKLFAFQLLVHKLLRYLVVVPLGVALLCSAFLASRPPYGALLGLQASFYTIALIGWVFGGRVRLGLVFVPFYFCLINLAAAVALVRFFRGERQVVWTPRTGQ